MATSRKKKISFEEWLDETGFRVVANYLGVDRESVRHWRTGVCNPKIDHMRLIKHWTKGRMGYDQMIDRKVLNSRISGHRVTRAK